MTISLRTISIIRDEVAGSDLRTNAGVPGECNTGRDDVCVLHTADAWERGETVRVLSGSVRNGERLKCVSLFTGAGGLDYGFEAAGFATRVAVEFDEECCETLRTNTDWPVMGHDLSELPSVKIMQRGGLEEGEVDLLLGGPPCQPFSKSGYWAHYHRRSLDDPRTGTLYGYMRCVRDMRPRVFVLENVAGLNYSGREEGFQVIEELAERINREMGTSYSLSWAVLNAADFGVPQRRKRLFIVGDREGRAFRFPEVTHSEEAVAERVQGRLIGGWTAPWVGAWEAIAGAEVGGNEDLRMRGKWAGLLPSIPEGENYLWHTDRKGGLPLFGWRTRFWTFLLKLAKNQPSWTIQAQPGPSVGPFHWDNRLLSVGEMAALQTFPKWVRFAGERRSVQRQIGNAVPCLLAEVLARAIGQQLFMRACADELEFMVPRRRPVPDPEPVLPVPSEYLTYLGDHAAHPGTGKGPGRTGCVSRVSTAQREESKQA